MLNALSFDLLATDIAYYLVRKGIPFRLAHSTAGRCVSLSEELKCNLNELKIQELKNIWFVLIPILKTLLNIIFIVIDLMKISLKYLILKKALNNITVLVRLQKNL
jgi:argininosuccinate lyase